MDKKQKEEFILLFNQGFEEVVLPQIEELREGISGTATKKELTSLKEEMRSGFERLERRTDNLADNHGQTKKAVDDHEKRIKKLESRRIVA